MTANLASSIKFRSLLSQLSKDEYLTFMSKIFDQNQIEWIGTSLFNYFMKSDTASNQNRLGVVGVNDILSSIIQSRQPNTDSTSPSKPNLDTLPRAIIGHAASFLDQKAYHRMEQTTRAVFIGCNAPNMLKQLDTSHIGDYSQIRLDKYESVETLTLDLPGSHRLHLASNLRNLQNLKLNGGKRADFEFNESLFQKMNGTVSLQLIHFGRERDFNANTFWKLLAVFKNMRFLQMYACFLHIMDADKIRQTLSGLQGLGIYLVRPGSTINLLDCLGGNLQHFTLWHLPWVQIDLNRVNRFSCLQEVRLMSQSSERVRSIVEDTNVTIRKCGIYPYTRGIPPPAATDLKLTMVHILKSCQQLEYLELESSVDDLPLVMEGIEDGIYETSKRQRTVLKIKVKVLNLRSARQSDDTKLMRRNHGRVTHWLERSETRDFVFALDVTTLKGPMDWAEMERSMADMLSTVSVNRVGTLFIVTSNVCIQTAGESWMVDLLELPRK